MKMTLSANIDEMDHATKFGDNDRLSAIVAKIIWCRLLIMLSDIDGLLLRTQMFMRMRPFVAMSQIEILAQLVVLAVFTGGMMQDKSAQTPEN